jgi:hypothetical protein
MKLVAVSIMAIVILLGGARAGELSEEYRMPKGEYAALVLDLACLRESIKSNFSMDMRAKYYPGEAEIGIAVFGKAESIEEAKEAVLDAVSKFRFDVNVTLKDKGIVFDIDDIRFSYLSVVNNRVQLKYVKGRFYTADWKD